MKIALITDTHLGCRNDSPIFREYFKRYFTDVFFPFLKEHGITKVIHAGDLWDRRKYINFETMNFFRKYFFDPLQSSGVEMDIILGNHDTYYKDTSRVNGVEELCGHYSNINIFSETTEVEYDGIKVLLIPWINQENQQRSMELISSTSAKIAIGHLELQGFLMYRGQKAEYGLSRDIFKKFSRVYSGHYHHQSTEDNITFLGSVFEITFADINDKRGVHTWIPKTDTITHYPNPFKMFHRLYYNDKGKELGAILKKVTDKFSGTYIKIVVENRTNPYYFDKFVEKMFSMNPADVKIEEDMNLTEGDDEISVDMADDTLTILSKYVEELDIDVDKSKIKEELRLLYIEAQNLER